MGLDQYLLAKIHFASYRKDHATISTEIKKLIGIEGENINVDSIKFNIGYWRKASSIHQWFVTNVQNKEDDCKEYYVSIDKLRELKYTCETALKAKHIKEYTPYELFITTDIENHPYEDVIESLQDLKPKTGCFFGYDEGDEETDWFWNYFFEDVEKTLRYIDIAFDLYENQESFYVDVFYQSSW